MKLSVLAFVLLGVFVLAAQAEPAPEPAKAKAKFRAAAEPEVVEEGQENADGADKGDPSSGRLFMKKFLLFKNIFGTQQQQQPVIPIIIAGGTGGGGTYATSPTPTSPTYTTVTSTGSIPTATGTITTSPTGGTGGSGREGYNNDENGAAVEPAAVDEQELQAALAAGAQEYVVTDGEIQGTAPEKAPRPNRINLRRKGAKKGQVVSVRIPPKYRQYFKNGQKVMLNTNNRPLKRRGVQRRVNRIRRRKGGKNRRRIVG